MVCRINLELLFDSREEQRRRAVQRQTWLAFINANREFVLTFSEWKQIIRGVTKISIVAPRDQSWHLVIPPPTGRTMVLSCDETHSFRDVPQERGPTFLFKKRDLEAKNAPQASSLFSRNATSGADFSYAVARLVVPKKKQRENVQQKQGS